MTLHSLRRSPSLYAGARIGLYGGSFDPPHAGHRNLALTALKNLDLHRVWILPSPANPLKPGPALSGAERLKQARDLMDHPRFELLDWHLHSPSSFFAPLLQRLLRHFSQTRFVLLLGRDSFASLPRWHHGQFLCSTVAIAVFNRPGPPHSIAAGAAFASMRRNAVGWAHREMLFTQPPPCWSFFPALRIEESSSRLRMKSKESCQSRPYPLGSCL